MPGKREHANDCEVGDFLPFDRFDQRLADPLGRVRYAKPADPMSLPLDGPACPASGLMMQILVFEACPFGSGVLAAWVWVRIK